MSVVQQGTEPKCAQAGQRRYGATVKCEVSASARGMFLLEWNSHPDESEMQGAKGCPVQPVQDKVLTVKVPAQVLVALHQGGNMVDAQVDANRGGERSARRLLLSGQALNEPDGGRPAGQPIMHASRFE